jgi:hypothetical protein
MKNSPVKRGRSYAPRAAVKRKRIGVGLDPVQLEQCQRLAKAEDKTDAAYVLTVYLEGLALRLTKPTSAGLARN